jgi:tight adherence protein B
MAGRLRRPSGGIPGSAVDTADTVLRLSVLLEAGIAPARAWEHLASTGDEAARRVCDAVGGGMPLPAAIARLGGAWAETAAAWTVATTVGAPLAASLRGIAHALRDAHACADDVRVSLAEPVGTARLMAWLPLVGVALGLVLGFDTVGAFATQPIGMACLAVGVALIGAARFWTTSLVRRAAPPPGVPGLEPELLAIALSGGVSVARARAVLVGAGVPMTPDTEGVVALSQRAGVPAVDLLRAAASLTRHRARIDGRLRAAKLSSRLLLPLGVCTLPAFLLLGVAPLVLSVLSTTAVPL